MTMFILLMSFVSVLAFSESVDYYKKYYSNCTGLDNCIRQQAKLQQFEIEYLSARYDKEKYDKLCLDIEKPYACYKKMSDTCWTSQLDLEFKRTRSKLQEVCDEYGDKFKQKENIDNYKKNDRICTELQKCIGQKVELHQLEMEYMSEVLNKEKYDKWCLDYEKPKACFDKMNDTCRTYAASTSFTDYSWHVKFLCKDYKKLFKQKDNVKEYHTNCTGLDICMRQQAELQQLEMEYMSAVHDKKKYDKLCIDLEKPFVCYQKMNNTCRIYSLELAFERTRLKLKEKCDFYGEKIKQKDAVTVLKKSDSNCTEVVKCLIQLIKTEKICVNMFHAMLDENCVKNLCTNSQKRRLCFAKQKGKCEEKPMGTWIDDQLDIYQLQCVNNGHQFTDEIWHVINKGCPRDKCYNDISNINIVELMKAISYNDVAKIKDFCQKRDIFNNCEEKYTDYCQIDASEQVVDRKELLNSLLVCSNDKGRDIAMEKVCEKLEHCSKSEVPDYIPSIFKIIYDHLLNKTLYNEICTKKDVRYECYLQKKKDFYCTKGDSHYMFEKRKLLLEFVCSDEGRKGIDALGNSPCMNTEDFSPSSTEYRYGDRCEWWASGLGDPCPYINRYGACLAAKFHKEEGCGPAFSSFYNKIYDIDNGEYKCKKDKEIEAKDRFLIFPEN